MAGRRISISAINWAAFAEKVPKSDVAHFQALKAKNDSYIRRIAEYKDSLPQIDWNYYKSRIAVPGMVENFQKSYETLKIPYPGDQGLIEEINKQEDIMKKEYVKFSAKIDEEIATLKEDLQKLEAQIPFSEMTNEEYILANSEIFPDIHKYPTFFPHNAESIEYTKYLKESGKL